MNELLSLNPNIVSDINISFISTVYAMLSSIFSAVILRILYVKFGRSMNNREYFGNIFILLSVTTCSVIVIVN